MPPNRILILEAPMLLNSLFPCPASFIRRAALSFRGLKVDSGTLNPAYELPGALPNNERLEDKPKANGRIEMLLTASHYRDFLRVSRFVATWQCACSHYKKWPKSRRCRVRSFWV